MGLLSIGLCGVPASAGGDAYVPYSGILSGTEGTEPVRLSVSNGTGAEMACTAALAHWFSQPLGRAAPGAALAVTLWHDPETGVLNLMNETDDRMPVEAIWCGTAGDMTATRTRIGLPHAAGAAAPALSRACRSGPDRRLRCVEEQG